MRDDAHVAFSQLARRVSPVLRFRYLIIAALAVVSAQHVALDPGHDDWPFFIWGSQLLFGSHPFWAKQAGGLHVFANYRVQIGPLTLFVVAVLRWLLGDEGSRAGAMIVMTGLAPAVVRLFELAAARLHGPPPSELEDVERRFAVLLGGGAMTVAWIELGVHWVHLDDGLTLLAAALAIWAVAARRPVLVGLMIAAGTAAKPWGIVLLPMVLAFDTSRARRRAALSAAAALLATWMPFVLADRGTLRAGQLGVKTSSRSVLHLLGVATGAMPTWVRPTQLLVALALASFAAWRGRWTAILLVGVSVRLLFDPAVFDYYTGGLVVAAFAWEILRKRPGVPWLTFVLLWAVLLVGINMQGDVLPALLRLVACAVAIVAALASPRDPVAAEP